MNSPEEIIRQHIHESLRLGEYLRDECARPIATIAEVITHAYQNQHKVLLFGNGGSAADAQHIAAELVGKYLKDRKPLAAIALTTNTSVLTAVSNDYGFERVFARQLEAIGAPGDVAIGISTSGKSRNVLLALEAARTKRLVTVALTGMDGGRIREFADVCICIPSNNIPCIQEAHIVIGHAVCEIVELSLFPGQKLAEPYSRGRAN